MKMRKSDLQLFLLGLIAALPYAWPYYYSVIVPGYSGLLNALFRYISYGITFVLLLKNRNKVLRLFREQKGFLLFGVSLFIVLLISTSINGGNNSEVLDAFIKCLFLILLLALGVGADSLFILKGMAFHYDFVIVMSLICALIPFPGLTGVYNFATTKNVFLRFIFLGILLNAYIDFEEIGTIRIKTIVLIGMVTVSTLLFGSSTGFVSSFVVLCLLLIKRYVFKEHFDIAKTRVFLFVSVGIGVLVVFLRQFTFYEKYVQQFFSKDITFTGRSTLWVQALVRIQQSPILGNGHLSSNGYLTFGNDLWSSASCHNLYLDVLVEMGVIGLIIFFVWLFRLSYFIDSYEDSERSQTFSIIFLCYLIAYNFEVYLNSGQYLYNIPLLFFLGFCFYDKAKNYNHNNKHHLFKLKAHH